MVPVPRSSFVWLTHLPVGVAQAVRTACRERAALLTGEAGRQLSAAPAAPTALEVASNGAPFVAIEGVDALVPAIAATAMTRSAGLAHTLRMATA